MRAATSASSRPVRSMSSTPGIRRIQVSWRRANARCADFIALDVASQELLEADRRARRAGGARLIGALGLLGRAWTPTIASTRVSIRASQLVPVEGDPGQERRAAKLVGPKALAGCVRRDPQAGELGQAGDALAVVLVNTGAKLLRQLFVEGIRAALRQIPFDLVTHLGGNGRAQLELGKSRAQVQARPAHDDRPPPLLEERIDLAVRELREAAGRELLGGIRDADEPVLEPFALLWGRRSAQDIEAAVDLDRVAADRDRVLPALSQHLGELDRDPGLPGRRRPEDRDDVHAPSGQPTRLRMRSCPRSVCEVAFAISTSTMSPGCAVPSKLTALL